MTFDSRTSVARTIAAWDEPRRLAFLRFVEQGEADETFLTFLDSDEECQAAVRSVMALQTSALRSFDAAIQHAQQPDFASKLQESIQRLPDEVRAPIELLINRLKAKEDIDLKRIASDLGRPYEVLLAQVECGLVQLTEPYIQLMRQSQRLSITAESTAAEEALLVSGIQQLSPEIREPMVNVLDQIRAHQPLNVGLLASQAGRTDAEFHRQFGEGIWMLLLRKQLAGDSHHAA